MTFFQLSITAVPTAHVGGLGRVASGTSQAFPVEELGRCRAEVVRSAVDVIARDRRQGSAVEFLLWSASHPGP
jgi:hypothetical protein